MTAPNLALALAALASGWSVTQEQFLTSPSPAYSGRYGFSVALDGNTAVVGAFGEGMAHVLVRSGATWTTQDTLVGSSGALGWSVAIDGDTVVAGARYEDHGGLTDAGAAYVFVRAGTQWFEQARLVASDPEEDARFGSAVTVDGDTAVVGAGTDPSGAAYVFTRSGTTWSQQAKLTASDPEPFDQFGDAVDLDGDTLVVGNDFDNEGGLFDVGSAYVFVRSGTTWTEQAKLTAPTPTDGATFGHSVAVEGDVVVAGAPDLYSPFGNFGAVHVFRRIGTTWTHQAVLTPGPGVDGFGRGVDLQGPRVAVSAPDTGYFQGSAHLWVREGFTWTEELYVLAPVVEPYGTRFGVSVALDGERFLVTADTQDAGSYDAGAVYAFRSVPPWGATYCTAGTSASGCNALVSASGTASATAPSGFVLAATGVEGAKDGLFYYAANGPQASPWGNGTSYQCVTPPVKRGSLMVGAGSPGLCDGTFALDLNARWCPACPKPSHNPGAGALVQAQLWYRDPASTSNRTTSRSDAIEFQVWP